MNHGRMVCFFRKKFSPFKDFISYYVSISEENDIKKLLKWQLAHTDMKKAGNSCWIIFAYMDEISEKTKVFVKNHGINRIASEEVFRASYTRNSNLSCCG